MPAPGAPSTLSPFLDGELRDTTGGLTIAFAMLGVLGALAGVAGFSPVLHPAARRPPAGVFGPLQPQLP